MKALHCTELHHIAWFFQFLLSFLLLLEIANLRVTTVSTVYNINEKDAGERPSKLLWLFSLDKAVILVHLKCN